MSTFKNIIVAGGLALAALTATAPAADARVTVGVGVGIAGPYHPHCRHHRYRCGAYAAGPRIGIYYGGRGWWDGHRYWGHRTRWHGGWRYR